MIGSTATASSSPMSEGSSSTNDRSQRARPSRPIGCGAAPATRCGATRATTAANACSGARPAWSSTPASRSKRPTPLSITGPSSPSTTRPTSRPRTSALRMPASWQTRAPQRSIIASNRSRPVAAATGGGSGAAGAATTSAPSRRQTVTSGASIANRRACIPALRTKTTSARAAAARVTHNSTPPRTAGSGDDETTKARPSHTALTPKAKWPTADGSVAERSTPKRSRTIARNLASSSRPFCVDSSVTADQSSEAGTSGSPSGSPATALRRP